jgi:hypothetical protein
VQTFLPFADFTRSAATLDPRRLNKQRVEAFQILRAITDDTYGWQHHPAVNMWRGHQHALAVYGLAMCAAWEAQGGADQADLAGRIGAFRSGPQTRPFWLGDPDVHRSHRSNLTRKDPDFYGRFWQEPDDLPYVWPV